MSDLIPWNGDMLEEKKSFCHTDLFFLDQQNSRSSDTTYNGQKETNRYRTGDGCLPSEEIFPVYLIQISVSEGQKTDDRSLDNRGVVKPDLI